MEIATETTETVVEAPPVLQESGLSASIEKTATHDVSEAPVVAPSRQMDDATQTLSPVAPTDVIGSIESNRSETEQTSSADEEGSEVLPEAAEEIQHRFKQALHGLTADKLDLRKPATDAAVNTAATEAVALGTANTTTSRLNVNHLLRQYADHTLDKGDQVNYYALAERTRLQKWMSTQSEDDLLTHAQKAYGEGYPNVAHHILNEVLLRGNAAQCTRALDLRNEWHIQALRQNAQQNRDS